MMGCTGIEDPFVCVGRYQRACRECLKGLFFGIIHLIVVVVSVIVVVIPVIVVVVSAITIVISAIVVVISAIVVVVLFLSTFVFFMTIDTAEPTVAIES